ncbi:MAG: Xaa-Pro peptidase family protein [Actinomycetota bacterium]|nr:Xaa-Pro peptidase family protein [Actinomycetota bacterium]
MTNTALSTPEAALDETSEHADRLRRAQAEARRTGVDALLVSPGADLGYLTGYDAPPLERLTCLVLPADGDPRLVVPALEEPAAMASPVAGLGLEVVSWQETDDPYALTVSLLPNAATAVAVDDRMWAVKALALAAAAPHVRQQAAGPVLRELRMRKTPAEVAALREASAAIDRVHDRMGEWLRPGRTEREVAAGIAAAIVAEGHARADFGVVASGPNAASPHAEPSDRTVEPGDVVVVDIGGTTFAGYCSDSTRTYVAAGEPPADFAAYYAVLLEAQQAQCAHVRPGVTAESVDAVGREIIVAAGYGDRFVHRTGHGIGRETHEEPYIVAGNALELEPGMAFSVEPGIYLPGRHGARIEDIVAVTAVGGERLNQTSRELRVLDA